MTLLHWTINLPAGYRRDDVLAFHGRDTLALSEQITPTTLRKGIVQDGAAVLLDVVFDDTQASCRAEIDGDEAPGMREQLHGALLNILGLRIDPAPFAQLVARDALIAPLLQANPGLRIVQSASPFEALTWAIIGQQINLSFAIALRRTFIEQAGRRHSSGLWCYPEAADVAQLNVEDLTSRKFSRAKADTVLRLAQLVDGGQLSLALPASGEVEAISQALLAVKGIGPWTVNYALLRGYAYADCSLHGDVAIRAALQKLLGEESKPDMARTEQWLRQYRPHRTMLAAHLWASLHISA
ncbi:MULTISPECIES: DNA-3-methyladenine glycosylase 2 family protein [unclassified Janthinobacterium]|uniref:DNA-3-methyladenine glycosylase 2 n=1 Tax=unclassified Janthinobacterium TaxID=2610881 RepID=UPI0016153817|nr:MULTISPECIES: DNA-3-methyladenine glycosylase 2 family protein [unclassified Janthinobacterium]MBB5608774.1 DNA-3-methyladenine glycosylase II [Janthinobacterium sp. S3T4]MBB5613823.1 DNA-3-methyladenine glycosylase II [Janthinobacterium sp. S3M3]